MYETEKLSMLKVKVANYVHTVNLLVHQKQSYKASYKANFVTLRNTIFFVDDIYFQQTKCFATVVTTTKNIVFLKVTKFALYEAL
jgi:hypothetical protein